MIEAVDVYLGLGANLGDRRGQIRAALKRLSAVPGVELVAESELRETEPVGGPPQGRYLNGVAKLRTNLPAHAFLSVCKMLERDAGRDLDGERNAPRPLDLDILLFGDQRIDTRALRVPHPRMTEREFVLEPLRELGLDVAAFDLPTQLRVVREVEEFGACTSLWLEGGCRTGLVPTMGALHDGHASLMRAARQECDRVAATVFVNPTQFGAGEDYEEYPRTFDADLEVLSEAGVDLVFAPHTEAMYPAGFCSEIAVGAEAEGLESASRPTHFAGVVTVVAKLLALARPHCAYFGQKDAQQLAVIRRLVRDLQFPTEIRACPIRREPDGLAMSSRNAYLSASERIAATALWRALLAAKARFRAGERDRDALVATASEILRAESAAAVDYVELRRDGDLRELSAGAVDGGRMLIAARIGATRLIDNALVHADWDEP